MMAELRFAHHQIGLMMRRRRYGTSLTQQRPSTTEGPSQRVAHHLRMMGLRFAHHRIGLMMRQRRYGLSRLRR